MELGAVLVGEGVVCVVIIERWCRKVLSRKWIEGPGGGSVMQPIALRG